MGCQKSNVVHYKKSEKRLCLNYVQMLWRWHLKKHKMGNTQCTFYHFLLSILSIIFSLIMWCFQLMCHVMLDIPPWVTQKSQEAGAALNMLGALRWLYNAQKHFCRCTLPGKLGVQLFDNIYHLGAHFQHFTSARQFKITENGSHLARKWCKRTGIELNAWSAGLKYEVTGCCCIWYPYAYMRSKIIFVFWGESIVIWS